MNNKKMVKVTILLIIITMIVFVFVKLNPIVSAIKTPKEELIFINSEYDSEKEYYDYLEEDLNDYQEIVLDENGIIQSLLDVKNDIYTYNMEKITKYGLVMYSAYIDYNDEKKYEIAKMQADYLIDFQDKETGMFYNEYSVGLSYINKDIKSKWGTSAIQGEALSLISRIYTITKEEKYKNSCELALKAFEKETYNGGVISYLDGNVFYDGYNLKEGIYNFSDFMKALIGLNDCYNNLGNEHAKELYNQGVKTLKSCIKYYDKDEYTLIDLTNCDKERRANKVENINHILLLQTINQIEKNEVFGEIIEKWKNLYEEENK